MQRQKVEPFFGVLFRPQHVDSAFSKEPIQSLVLHRAQAVQGKLRFALADEERGHGDFWKQYSKYAKQPGWI